MMKQILLFFLFSGMVFAQKTQFIQLTQSIKDKNKIAKSLTLIDRRDDKTIGTVSHRKEPYELKFEEENLENLFQKWFLEDNKTPGNTEFLLILEELKAGDEQKGKLVIGKLKLKMVTFIKRNDKYYFVKRINIMKDYKPNDHAYITRAIAYKISLEISSLIKDSYSEPITNFPISESELNDYEKVISGKFKLFNSEKLTDGVYTDYRSFYKQEPNNDYSVKKNNKGVITGVSNIKGYDTYTNDVFAIVDNGVAYRSTPFRLIEMVKEDNKFYVLSSKEELFPTNNAGAAVAGALIGGIVGGVIGAVIDASSTKKNIEKAGLSKIEIDPLTGEYDFSNE